MRTVEINMRNFTFAVCTLLLLFAISIPGEAAADVPTVISITRTQIQGGDSFLLTADDPFPKEFITSRNDSLTLEFNRLDCALPRGINGSFATPVKGLLANRLDVNINGTPPSTTIKFGIESTGEYSFVLIKHGPKELEVRLTTPAEVCSPSIQVKHEIPKQQHTLSTFKPIDAFTKPEFTHKVPEPKSLVTTVKHVKLDDGGDRIEFTFEGPSLAPMVGRRYYPDKIELRFPSTKVRLPNNMGSNKFTMPIPGLLVEKLHVFNPDTTGGECIIQLDIKNNQSVLWELSDSGRNKMTIDIQRIDLDREKPAWISQFSMDRVSPYISPLSKPCKPKPAIEVVTLPKIQLDLNWPDESDVLLDQISILISKIGGGFTVDLPLELKLHLGSNASNDSPSPLQQ